MLAPRVDFSIEYLFLANRSTYVMNKGSTVVSIAMMRIAFRQIIIDDAVPKKSTPALFQRFYAQID